MKTWTEIKLCFETQNATIQPNELLEGVVLITEDCDEKSIKTRLYLTKQEALYLASQLIDFANKLK
jgi:hypothetical protein